MLKEQESNQKTEVESEKRPKYIPVLVVKNKTPEGIDYLQAIGVDSNGSPVVTNGENIEKLFENCPQPVYYQAAYESGDLLTVEAKPEIGELKPNDIRILGTEYSISSSSKEGGLSKTQIVIGPDTTQDEPEQNIPLKKLIKAMASIDECSDIYYAWLDPDDKNSQPKMIIFGEPQTSFDN